MDIAYIRPDSYDVAANLRLSVKAVVYPRHQTHFHFPYYIYVSKVPLLALNHCIISVMSAESKEVDPQVDAEIINELVAETDQNGKTAMVEDASDGEDTLEPTNGDEVAGSSKSKKKKSKKARLKKALMGAGQDESSGSSSNPASKLTPEMVEQLLEMNPSLGGEVAGMNKEKAAQVLKKLDVADLLTGMVRLPLRCSSAGLLMLCSGC